MPGSKKKPQTNVIIRVILVLGAIGMLVSLYLVKDHYNTQKSICDLGNHFSCSVINKSIYSMLFNVPVAVFGVLWFVVMIGFSLKIWENPSDSSYWIGAHMAWSVIGALFCFYFIYAEFMLQAICPFCTIVHIICFIVLGLSWKIFNQQRTSFSLLELILYFIQHQTVWVAIIAAIHIAPIIYFNTPITKNTEVPVPVSLDPFAKCLDEAGVIMYGSNECSFCNRQKELFGDSFEFVQYINCGQEETMCYEKKVNALPTWLRFSKDGKEIGRHVGLLTLKELSEFSSCKLSSVKSK